MKVFVVLRFPNDGGCYLDAICSTLEQAEDALVDVPKDCFTIVEWEVDQPDRVGTWYFVDDNWSYHPQKGN